jgi:hypothetical protein
MLILMMLMLTNDYYFLLYIILIYSRLHDHEVIWAYGKLVAIQLLKDDSIKANRSKPVSTFEPHEPYDIFAVFDMDSVLLFPTSQEGY